MIGPLIAFCMFVAAVVLFFFAFYLAASAVGWLFLEVLRFLDGRKSREQIRKEVLGPRHPNVYELGSTIICAVIVLVGIVQICIFFGEEMIAKIPYILKMLGGGGKWIE